VFGREAMNRTSLHTLRLGLFGLLSFLDLGLTYRLIKAGGGAVYESNPIANEWLQRFGWLGLATFKIMAMSIVASAAIYISMSRPHVSSRLLNFACLVVCTVVVYSFCMSNAVGKGVRDGLPAVYTPLYGQDGRAGASDRDDTLLFPPRISIGVFDESEQVSKVGT
jgi:hypothetical protein